MYIEDFSEFDEELETESDEAYYSILEKKKILEARKRKRRATSFILVILSILIFLSSVSLISIILMIRKEKKESENKIATTTTEVITTENTENISTESINEVSTPQEETISTEDIFKQYPNDGQYRYFRNNLSDEKIKIYDDILEGIKNMDDVITIYSNNFDDVEKMLTYIYADNPDCFWYDCTVQFEIYSYEIYKEIRIKPQYTMDKSAAELYWVAVNDYINKIVNETSGMTDYQKVKYVYESIIENTKYDLDYRDNTCVSVITNGRGVCSGYSATMQLVLNRLGIQTLLCMGKADGEPHAWNMVLLNNNWYQMDVTFGDPISVDGINWITYDYFLVKDEKIMQNHEYDEDIIYPTCNNSLEEKESDFWLIEHIT